MDEKLYQNIDLPQNNPLDITDETSEVTTKKPLNPKMLLLIILGSLIFVLLLLSLIITRVQKNKSNSTSATPTPVQIVALPSVNDSLLPSPYQELFRQLEQSFSQDPDLPVPQIDTEIGL
jgi:hypothetical protein